MTQFYNLLNYYKSNDPAISYSLHKQQILLDGNTGTFVKQLSPKVEILCYCFMPTHFHLLIKQVKDGGIVDFISKTKNSFTKYFNKTHNRNGYLFIDRFNAVHIESEEQLLHVSRYIHLNPYSSSIVKDINKLENYKWSSYKSYVTNEEDKLINNRYILKFFGNNKDEYKKFVMDRGDYQKSLEILKYL
ncbi:hypothetical protein CO178_01185 [candidate division WWE3 bacterium CG_4_9_14_3_um_filter_34_6]|uniref:Transposase IS200-like domain-containing protein n=1 Tax=candidate division WWE3 bacterium CG_4_9_14_3_um_filter_34_6 TaxID=1975079 RepID=A0A2M7X455_UNCKA|nr:MAG: hypothetical protein CO178_01185 [candidate division WWE3 bacterium CG_4_9_14_3_um_filter_34_6]